MRFLITAGGTREYIDPVRFISNASSGKMGYALARAAIKRGHKVTLITAKTHLRRPAGAKVVEVETSGEMFAAVKKHFAKCGCLVMAAAVSDYKVSREVKSKMKKSSSELVLKLKATDDILKWAGRNKSKKRVVVGFALEDKDLRNRAGEKLRDKKLDMIVANRPTVIGQDRATVEIKIAGGGWEKIENATKAVIAGKIISRIGKLMS